MGRRGGFGRGFGAPSGGQDASAEQAHPDALPMGEITAGLAGGTVLWIDDCMTDEAVEPAGPVVITRDGLADGSLLANIRTRLLPGMVVRSDAEIPASLQQTLASHNPPLTSGCSATAR